MIVADTNLLVYFVVPGNTTSFAERVRAREKIWAVPSLLPHELLNVLALHVRQQKLDRDAAIRAYRRGLSIVQVAQLKPDPAAILRMMEEAACSTYDLEFVWTAQQLGVPLVIADQQILKTYPDVAVSIQDFATGK